MIEMVIEMAGTQSKLIEIANKLTLGTARMNHIKKDVLASVPAWLLHLPGKSS
jgi:hypothetical protein